MHPLEKGLFRLFCAEEVIEDSAFDAKGLFPAWRAFANRIFKVIPHSEQDIIRIENVSGERVLAVPAKICAGHRLVPVSRATAPQQLQPRTRVQQPFQGVRFNP